MGNDRMTADEPHVLDGNEGAPPGPSTRQAIDASSGTGSIWWVMGGIVALGIFIYLLS